MARVGFAIIGWTPLVVVASAGAGPGSARRGNWALSVASGRVLRALGVRLEVSGAPRPGAGLVVGNHTSWLDILVLSASAPMRQVAKSEVEAWPLVGLLARRGGALFLQREHWRELPGLIDRMAVALRQGHRVQVFPEATTRCGGAVGAFYRAGFQAAIDAAVAVQPVALRYLDSGRRPTAAPAFVGAEELSSSLGRVVAMDGLTVQVHWLPAVPAIAATGIRAVDRARLTTLVETAVAADLGLPVLRRTRSLPRVRARSVA